MGTDIKLKCNRILSKELLFENVLNVIPRFSNEENTEYKRIFVLIFSSVTVIV